MPDLADNPDSRFVLAHREEFEAITRPLIDMKAQIYMRAKLMAVLDVVRED